MKGNVYDPVGNWFTNMNMMIHNDVKVNSSMQKKNYTIYVPNIDKRGGSQAKMGIEQKDIIQISQTTRQAHTCSPRGD
jgi:hypothetical protein